MAKLQLNRTDGKKGSQKAIELNPDDAIAFEKLKATLAESLELFRVDPDQPFVLHTDASDWAVGAVLQQQREGRLVPVGFFSRKLGGSQLNWTPREKETYAIVVALRKWAGWIGFQPVVVKIDHRSLESWTTELVDTPSGPRGRRARWHETLSQFNLQVEYVPGPDNFIADALSRWAYPATGAREDVSFHGSAESCKEVKKMIELEKSEGRSVGVVVLGRPPSPVRPARRGVIMVIGAQSWSSIPVVSSILSKLSPRRSDDSTETSRPVVVNPTPESVVASPTAVMVTTRSGLEISGLSAPEGKGEADPSLSDTETEGEPVAARTRARAQSAAALPSPPASPIAPAIRPSSHPGQSLTEVTESDGADSEARELGHQVAASLPTLPDQARVSFRFSKSAQGKGELHQYKAGRGLGKGGSPALTSVSDHPPSSESACDSSAPLVRFQFAKPKVREGNQPTESFRGFRFLTPHRRPATPPVNPLGLSDDDSEGDHHCQSPEKPVDSCVDGGQDGLGIQRPNLQDTGAERRCEMGSNLDPSDLSEPMQWEETPTDPGLDAPEGPQNIPLPPELTPLDPEARVVYVMPWMEFTPFTQSGIFAAPGEVLHFFRYHDSIRVEEGDYLAHIDVPKCILEDIPLYFHSDGTVVSHGVSRYSYLPNTYVQMVEDPNTGEILWGDSRPSMVREPDHIDLGFRFATPRDRSQLETHPGTPPHIMDSDWTESYRSSAEWSEAWQKAHDQDGEWPANYQLREGRMFLEGKLCVPESLVADVLASLHENAGHLGAERLVIEAKRRLQFPKTVNLSQVAIRVKRLCLTCQECEPPNWSLSQPVRMAPIPNSVFSHICVDIFSMPAEVYQGEEFDCMVVWVDRLSGWILARPSQKRGLTAEKTASIMIDAGWDIFGVPDSITSDQGPQFAGKFFRTVCSRLGIRQAFSHAHRPQGNGRAEMAGKQLITLLRKLNSESGINWVEALPRALHIHHGIPGETGLSPHQIVFGRDRNVTGISYPIEPECEDAQSFVDRMNEMDQKIAQILTERHRKTQEVLNRKRKARPAYTVGEQVWYLRPKGVGGNKISTWWTGPFRVHARTGASSYELETAPNVFHECHADQLKPGPPLPANDEGVPLFFNRSRSCAATPHIEVVRAHGTGAAGIRRFLVHWLQSGNCEDSWVTEPELERDHVPTINAYCAANDLPPVTQAQNPESAIEDMRDQASPPDRALKFSPAWFENGCATDCSASGVPADASIEADSLIDRVGGEPVGDSLEAE